MDNSQRLHLSVVFTDQVFREQVALTALHYARSHRGAPLVQQLERQINARKIPLNGFSKSPFQAVATPRIKELATKLAEGTLIIGDAELFGALLRVWVEANPELAALVRTTCAERGLDLPDDPCVTAAPAPRAGMMAELAEAVVERAPDAERQAVFLMVAALTGLLEPGDNKDETEEGQGAPPDAGASPEPPDGDPAVASWDDLLARLRAMPADAALWEEAQAGAFLAALAELVEEKRLERSGRARVAAAVERLQTEAAEQISNLELGDIAHWSAQRCPLSAAAAVAAQLETLFELIERWHATGTAPLRRSERSAWRAEQERLEATITELHAQLAAVLAAPPPRPDDHTQAAPVVPEELPPPADDPSGSQNGLAPETAAPGPEPEIVAPAATPEPPTVEGEPADTTEPTVDTALPAAAPEPPTVEDEPAGAAKPPPPADPTDEAAPLDATPAPPAIAAAAPLSPTMPAAYLAPLAEPELDAAPNGAEPSGAYDEAVAPVVAPLDSAPPAADELPQLVWALIADDDTGGAYWLSRGLSARAIELPLDPALLQVLAGTRWLLADPDNSGALAADIAAVAARYQPFGRDEEVMLGLGASMLPALRAPASGLLDWVEGPDHYPVLRELAGTIRDFASQGLLLRDEELRGFADQTEASGAISAAVEAARRWMEVAPTRRTGYARASDVWRELVSRGELHDLMATACENQREDAQRVRQQLRNWRDRAYVIAQLRTLDRAVSKSGAAPIVGDARDQLLRDVSDACDIIEHWCNQVDRGQQLGGSNNAWLLAQITDLRDGISGMLPDVERTLTRLQTESPAPGRQAAARYLQRRFAELCATLGLSAQTPPVDPAAVQWNSLRSGQPEDEPLGRGLAAVLARRLWPLPGVSIGDDGQATDEGLRALPEIVHASRARRLTVEQIIAGWRSYGDFRWVETLRSLIPDAARSAEVNREIQDALQAAVVNLKRRIDEARRPLEMAVFAGDIDDDTRTRLEGQIEQIDPVRTRNFVQVRQQLSAIEAELAREQERRVDELRERWGGLRLDLAARLSDDHEVARLGQIVEVALERRNTWEINEALARADRIIQSGTSDDPLVIGEESGAELRQLQQSFLERLAQLEEALRPGLPAAIAAVRGRESLAGFSFANRPDTAVSALESWRRMRIAGNQIPANQFSGLLKDVLSFLGFEHVTVKAEDAQQRARHEARLPGVTMSLPTGRGRPLPQISGATARQYDLLVLWDREESLRTQLQRVAVRGSAEPLLLIYLGPLKSAMRRDIARLSRERPLLVLDELILLALATEQERDTRFKIWLQCSLPFTIINPYVPNAAGNVPAEIFYGRHEEVRDLIDPNGSCLVYGGRQLGKSALLTAVKRLFHNPARGQHAWIENIDLVGDEEVNQPASALWDKIRVIFRDHLGIIRPFRAEKPEDIAREVSRYMQQHPETRVLLLFDEADDFLDHDAEGRFQVVIALRQLMQETNRRFKVVFTGLHDVQRFAAIPNQPLAHFGRPICIGPLPPAPARDLITQPLEALGYRFEHEAIVLRILSYTNYHAGLIQIFCHELLKQLQRPQRADAPPFAISQRDVDSAYLAVRNSIRNRFELTLNLDARYRAFALALIVDQLSSSEGFAQAYQASTALNHAQSWWPAGFEETSTDEAQGLLDEMCGLGVLIRTTDGGYRLRSPNLVRLLGSTSEVEDALDKLSKSRPPSRSERDTYHMPLDGEGRTHFSPLTYAQERVLQQTTSAVSIIVGSELSRMSLMPAVLERFATNPQSQGTIVIRVPAGASRRTSFFTWVRAQIEQQQQYERLIFACQPAGSGVHELAELVRDALSLSGGRRQPRPAVKVVFLFGPTQAAAWASLPEQERQEQERQLTLLSLQRWTPAAVRKRLQLRELNEDDASLQAVLRATGNWQLLLDALFEQVAQTNDLRQACAQLQEALRDPESALSQRIRLGQELHGNPDIVATLRVLHDNTDGRVSMVDLLEYIQVLTEIPPDRGEAVIVALERLGLIDRVESDVVLAPLARQVLEDRHGQQL